MPTVPAAVRGVIYRGSARECPCCGGEFRKFLPAGEPSRPEALCPRCGALERHRLLTLYLRRFAPGVGGKVLHIAPESATASVFRSIATEYVTADLYQPADVKADLTDLPFSRGRWDLIVCAHVLEHVADDAAAMRELARVLTPGGRALVMVPRNIGVPTDEDPSISDPQERIRRFGQDDHVRIYGDDLEGRLRTAGFDVIQPITPDAFTAEEIDRHRLRPVNAGNGEAAMLCGVSAYDG